MTAIEPWTPTKPLLRAIGLHKSYFGATEVPVLRGVAVLFLTVLVLAALLFFALLAALRLAGALRLAAVLRAAGFFAFAVAVAVRSSSSDHLPDITGSGTDLGFPPFHAGEGLHVVYDPGQA